jgi:hydrogenase expression/formation protein HypD
MIDALAYLQAYDGPVIAVMEVCGTHTTEIARSGLRSLISPKIRLISGPGCPVCVTVTSYIDRLIALSHESDTCVLTFGDMLRVPGSFQSLTDAKAAGGRIEMVYSPLQLIDLAQKNPHIRYVFAAVGFETTAAVYAAVLEQVHLLRLKNVRFLTSLKTMPQAISYVLEHSSGRIDGLLAPGHVSVITGSGLFEPLADRFRVPFVVAGFDDRHLLSGIYALVRLIEAKSPRILNLYPSAVTGQGNIRAQEKIREFFEPCDASWRGIGVLPASGLILREEFEDYDAGSKDLTEDRARNRACRCSEILVGNASPAECPLFAKSCTPENPVGACMVSSEGSCRSAFENERRENWTGYQTKETEI